MLHVKTPKAPLFMTADTVSPSSLSYRCFVCKGTHHVDNPSGSLAPRRGILCENPCHKAHHKYVSLEVDDMFTTGAVGTATAALWPGDSDDSEDLAEFYSPVKR